MPVTKDRCRSIHLDVVCGPVSAETGALLLHSLVKHFLYMRGQLPDLYDELCWQLQEKNQEDATPATPQTRKRLSHAEKRLVKTLTSVEDMLRCLTPDMLARQDVWWISLLFGPTPQSPHEVYDVVLETQGREHCALLEEEDEERWPGILEAAEERAHRLAKKVIRTLVTLAPDIPETKTFAGPTRFFVLVHCQPQSTHLDGFVPKRAYQQKFRRTLQVVIDLTARANGARERDGGSESGIASASAIEQSMPEEAHADPEGGEMLWYQCTTSVKGFSCRSQHKSEPCG